MKNRYTIFLFYLCCVIISAICMIQIYNLSQYDILKDYDPSLVIVHHFRISQTVTLLLSISVIAILFSKEGINQGIKRKAYTDITGIMNKHACLEELAILDCEDSTLNIGIAMFDLNNLKEVNDYYGHEEGDALIQSFVLLLREASEKNHFLGRFGGDEFIVIMRNCDELAMLGLTNHIRRLVDFYNSAQKIQLSYACGYSISNRDHYYPMDDLLNDADKKMYENKKMSKSSGLFSASERNRIQAIHVDALTDASNYEVFLSNARKWISTIKKQSRFAIVRSDINNFRYINESYGHIEGNKILKTYATELCKESFCLCCCRIHSDNFAFLADLSQMSEEAGSKLIENWNIEFSSHMNQSYKGSRLIVKSGIYYISDVNESLESILDKADCARKSTKASFQNIFIYSDALFEAERKRLEIINTFQSALANEEFKVYIQPKVMISDKSICGAESLVRWERPNGDFFFPDEFIPIFEQTGDVIDMDFYVYEKVFFYLYHHCLANETNIPISVNVSRVHLANVIEFLNRIRALHDRYPIPTKLITFELTESAYIQEINSAALFIDELHKLGYQISLDDFGSGYSSLKALQSIPFDEIKFDKAFLLDTAHEKENRIFLQIIQLVKSLHLSIVCEGVETADNVALLERSECDVMQGYYYYKPFPLEKLSLSLAKPDLGCMA